LIPANTEIPPTKGMMPWCRLRKFGLSTKPIFMATFRAKKIKMVVNKKILINSDKAASKFTAYVLSAYIISLKYNALRRSLEVTI
jgi:CRISPR/Cas system-associated protein Csm6